MAHPVRARRHVVPEHVVPAADPHVGGDDRRALLVARHLAKSTSSTPEL